MINLSEKYGVLNWERTVGMRKKQPVAEILEQLKSTAYGDGLEVENEELLGMKSKQFWLRHLNVRWCPFPNVENTEGRTGMLLPFCLVSIK